MGFVSSLKSHIEEESRKCRLGPVSLYVMHSDGMVAYHNSADRGGSEIIGSLVCGAWHASHAILGSECDDDFRFSFDTGSHGVHVLPLSIGGKRFYLAGVFSQTVNIGQLKMKLKNIKFSIENKLNDTALDEEAPSDEVLFSGITDKEIDRLFVFAEE